MPLIAVLGGCEPGAVPVAWRSANERKMSLLSSADPTEHDVDCGCRPGRMHGRPTRRSSSRMSIVMAEAELPNGARWLADD